MRTPLSVLTSLLLAAHYATGDDVPTCNRATYGNPTPGDCQSLLTRFTTQKYMTTRLFDEEQLRVEADESWPGVQDNPFVPPIVQLPKYVTLNTCNFALMPYTNPDSLRSFPLVISDWASINSSGIRLLDRCLNQQSMGGEIFIRAPTSINPVLVLFLWANGAEFEKKLVKYEYDPTYSPQLSLMTNDTNETNGTSSDSIAPVNMAIKNSSVSALPFKESQQPKWESAAIA